MGAGREMRRVGGGDCRKGCKMAEVSGGTGRAGSGRGAAARAERKVKRRTGKKRGTGSKKGGERRERSGSTAGGGAACFKEAADLELKSSAKKLAKKLLERAGDGDLPSLRYVVSLAEEHEAKEEEVDPGPVLSQALAWAAEPQWVDPPEELLDPQEQRLKGEEWLRWQLCKAEIQEAGEAAKEVWKPV